MKKQQLQVIALSAASIVFVGVLFYYYRDAILPQPTPAEPLPPFALSVDLPNLKTDLFDRSDYRSSRSFGGAELNPVIREPSNPFRAVDNQPIR